MKLSTQTFRTRPSRPTLAAIAAAVILTCAALSSLLIVSRGDQLVVVPTRNTFFKTYRLQTSLGAATVDRIPALPSIEIDVAVTSCATNNLSHNIVVSIKQRHLWACDGITTTYDSPVITGMAFLAADLTPTGSFHIYSKQANLYLTGSDSTGSWNDYVNYWLPFLSNRYGVYGFHDATWRDNSAFGSVSPDSTDASHGCVELPLSTAAWINSWAGIGTTVTIIN